MYKLQKVTPVVYLSLGWPVSEEQLEQVAAHAGVLEVDDDYLDARFRGECERLIPKTEEIKPEDCVDAFLFLKTHFSLPATI
ncbi:hypothetical protein OS493_026144 [Desmophyllum pertusum]|uniref:Uncharacterized protein n=1 Tax=Desmophyllum pertusum TaxID=174260 RepID=A0A9X0D9V2_9CNID|nr:hypothetical protein OS493_026144 [Desmophyllum pertusum]